MTVPTGLLDRLIRWSRRHVVLVDTAWALLWTAIGLLWQPPLPMTPTQNVVWLGVVAIIGIALVLRRIRPRTSIAILAATLVTHLLVVNLYTMTAAIGTAAAAYTTHSLLPRRQRLLVTVLILLGTAWAALSYPEDAIALAWWQRWPIVIAQWVVVVLFCLLGALRRKRREEFDHAIERARLLEAQQAQEVRLAALDERTHIAREMHDIVAHSLGVIIAQADGGRYAAATDPQASVTSLETIATIGRESLAEMRQLLTVLRGDEVRDRMPAPSLNDLGRLVEDYRAAGLDVRLVMNELPDLPETTALTVYRIVQEGLANALKHAVATTAKVTLSHNSDRISIEVINRLPQQPTSTNPTGHGLMGMRERVALRGGALQAGPEGANWRVYAEIPLLPSGDRVRE